jgi:Siphovirus Gp157
MSSLIELVKRANELEQALVESGGEITDLISQIDNDLKTDIQRKAEDYYFVIERMKANAEFYKLEADKYFKIAKALDATHERIKDFLKSGMVAMDISEIIGEKVKIKLSDSKGRMEIIDENDIPQQYKMVVTTHEIDKEKLRADLEDGVHVIGAKLVKGKTIRFTVNKGKK